MRKVLKASAGTGKTYRLSLEYLAAILSGDDFEEIVVMTFTRKATAEIRERIFQHIEEILEDGENSNVLQSLQIIHPELQVDLSRLGKIYEDMLINKEKIRIFTIDSFINRIFKKAIAPYLGVYSYQIIDENKNKEIIEEVFKKLLDDPEDFALMEKFLKDNTERFIKNYLDLINEILNNRWKFLLIDFQKRKERATENLSSYLAESLNILESIAVEKGLELSESFFVKNFQAFFAEYFKLETLQEREEKICQNYPLFFRNSFWNGRKVLGKAVADLKEALEEKYEDLLQGLAAYIYNEEMIPYEEEIFKFSRRIFQIYDGLKMKEKVFTHTDISNYTYRYFYDSSLDLLEGTTVSEYFFELLGNNVKSLYIDEFQDTSILQWKILKPLINQCENIITVGDEKQSIYGWRGGEKELFAGLGKILAAEEESLLTCYRSEKEIVEFVNRFFTTLDLDWNYAPVEYLAKKKQGYVEVLLGGENTRTNTETKSFEKLSQEKQEEIIELNEKITGDLKKEIVRRTKALPAYNNIAILARSNKDLAGIAAELDQAGIPYLLESKDSLLEHEAIKPLYFLLSYLNYHDYFHLIKFLRSDLLGINNKALRYLLQNKAKVESFMLGEEIELDYPDLQELLQEVKRLEKMEYQRLSNYIIEYSGLLKKYAENKAAIRNIYYFFQLMRNYSSLSEFMLYLEENKESDELKQLPVKGDNGVQLMTIHKAKGLSFETEFFYWNISSAAGNGSGNMELYLDFDEEYQEVEDYLLTNSRYEKLFPYLGIDFAEKKARKETVEEINNLYVALTRPEKNLFIFIEGPRRLALDKEGRCWKGSSYEYYEDALLNGAQVDTLCELVEEKSIGSIQVCDEMDINTPPPLPDLSPYFKPTIYEEELLKENNYKKDFEMTLEKEIKRIEGLAIHYYLEYIKYNQEEERRYAEEMVLARYGNILGPVKLNVIIERVNTFIHNNEEYFVTGWQVFNEYELEYKGEVYRIDQLRVNKEKKEILILDYKSGITKEQAQLDRYKEIIAEKTKGEYRIRTEFLEI